MSKRLDSQINRPRVPDDLRIYAIGDIHGRADLLDDVLTRIDAHLDAHPITRAAEIYVGDYIDRGSESRKVVDHLIARRQVREMVCLKGNHETFIPAFLNDPAILDEWRRFGGLETLLSYGLAPSIKMDLADKTRLAAIFAQTLPDGHSRFLADLELSFTCGDFFFAHAGVRPGIPLAQQCEEDLLWIRQDFLRSEEDFGKIVVHGHTPVRNPDVRPNRINIDTGAFATGQLTCLMLEDDKISFL